MSDQATATTLGQVSRPTPSLADMEAEIHLWEGDDSSPVDLDVLRRSASEIERLRERVAELEAALREVRAVAHAPGSYGKAEKLVAIVDRALGEPMREG